MMIDYIFTERVKFGDIRTFMENVCSKYGLLTPYSDELTLFKRIVKLCEQLKKFGINKETEQKINRLLKYEKMVITEDGMELAPLRTDRAIYYIIDKVIKEALTLNNGRK